MLDYRRKFIEAAQRYHEISFKSVVGEDEQLAALEKALTCTILASAGMIVYSVIFISITYRHTYMYPLCL